MVRTENCWVVLSKCLQLKSTKSNNKLIRISIVLFTYWSTNCAVFIFRWLQRLRMEQKKDSFLWSLIGSLLCVWSWMNGSVTSLSLGLLSKHCGSHSSLFKELKCVNCPFDRNTSTCDFSIRILFGIKMNFQSI